MKALHIKKPTGRQVKRFVIHALLILLGNLIASSASAFFVKPSGLTMGGTTGLGIFFSSFWENDFAVSLVVYIANIVLFIFGAIFLGKKFAIATFAGTILYPTFMSMWTAINLAVNDGKPLTQDPLLAAVIGAVLFGFGIGLAVRMGASTGGTDIPALVLHKFFNLPVSVGLWSCDILIILLQGTTSGVESVLYGIVLSLVSSLIIDKISIIGIKRMQVQIISRHHQQIREMILDKLNRGVTMYSAKTGFLKENTYVLMTVVSNRDVVKLTAEVQAIDPEAFFMVSVISEVKGRGFSSDRIALQRPTEEADKVE